MDKQKIVAWVRQVEDMRQQVQSFDCSVQALTPEERLVLDMLVRHPAKGNVQKLCQILEVEESSIYRRREKALGKLARQCRMDN